MRFDVAPSGIVLILADRTERHAPITQRATYSDKDACYARIALSFLSTSF